MSVKITETIKITAFRLVCPALTSQYITTNELRPQDAGSYVVIYALEYQITGELDSMSVQFEVQLRTTLKHFLTIAKMAI